MAQLQVTYHGTTYGPSEFFHLVEMLQSCGWRIGLQVVSNTLPWPGGEMTFKRYMATAQNASFGQGGITLLDRRADCPWTCLHDLVAEVIIPAECQQVEE